MTDTMKAVMYYAPKDLRVETIAVPACGDDEIRIEIDACAVCGTDLKSYLVGNPRIKAPLVSGHEFTGRVETIGAQVNGFSIGDRVVMATSVSCGECYYCRQGWRNLCADAAPMGFSYPGGMAEYVTLPARALKNGHVIKVPSQVEAQHAALAEPVSCTVNSAENCNIRAGDSIVVIGAGPMGIINACVAKGLGAKKVLLAEVNEARLKQAESFGFDRLVNSATDNLTQIVLDETDGYGADVAIIAAPAAQPQEQALEMVRKRGTVCLFASLPVGKNILSMDSRAIHYKELRVVGTSDSTPMQVQKAVDLIAQGDIPAEKLATHQLPLDGIFEAFELMQRGESLRVVLKP